MNLVYEEAKDLHVRRIMVYQGTGANAAKAFVDAECSVQFKTSELKNAFIKGCLIKLSDGKLATAIDYSESSNVGSVSYGVVSENVLGLAALAAVADAT